MSGPSPGEYGHFGTVGPGAGVFEPCFLFVTWGRHDCNFRARL